MAIANGKKTTGFPGLHVLSKDGFRDAIIQLDDVNTAPTTATGYYYLYVDGGVLYWDNGSSAVALGSGGSTPTWDTIYAIDKTLTLDSTTFTMALEHATNNGLTLTGSAGSAGHCLAISNAGSGYDVYGTSGTWYITKTGVATFATGTTLVGTTLFGSGSAAGTISSNGAYDLVLETNSSTNSMTVTLVDGTNGDIDIVMNGTGKIDMSGTTTHNTAFKVGAGDMELTLGNFAIISDWTTEASLSIVNDSVQTLGAAADLGVFHIASESLTTGILLNLSADETNMAGGYFFRCWSQDAGAYAFRIGELGITNIAGSAGNNTFTITAGDVVWSDGSLAITDADNAATLTVTNNTATTASVVVLAGSGVFTGSTTTSWMTITPSGLTTGTAVYLPVAALTEGVALHVVGNALTSGQLVSVSSSNTTITTTGRLFLSTHSGNAGVTATLNEFISAAADETTILQVKASAALAAGKILNLSGASVTTGTALAANDLNALTTGIGLHIASSATAITGAGRLVYVNHTGTTGTSATLVEFLTAATDETVLAQFKASGAITGTVLNLSAAATVTGTVLALTDLAALTTGKAVSVSHATSVIANGGSLLNIASSGVNTSTTSGSLVNLSSTGSTSGTQVLATFSALTDGIGISVVAAAATTGTLLKLTGTAATLTGKYIQCYDGAADDFSVGQYGAVTIAGNAGTNVLTVTAGHAVVTAGNLTLTLGNGVLTNGDLTLSEGKITATDTADEYALSVTANVSAATQAVALIKNDHATSGKSVLELSQDDQDKPLLKFTATAGAGNTIETADKSGGTAVYAMIDINGSAYYIKCSPGA